MEYPPRYRLLNSRRIDKKGDRLCAKPVPGMLLEKEVSGVYGCITICLLLSPSDFFESLDKIEYQLRRVFDDFT